MHQPMKGTFSENVNSIADYYSLLQNWVFNSKIIFCSFWSSKDENLESKSPKTIKSTYKWSLEEVGSRARSDRVSKFYGKFAKKADELGISHACFASYLGYRLVIHKMNTIFNKGIALDWYQKIM